MTDVQTLVDSHTRAELDQIATEAGVEGAAEMANKEAVAEAIVAADAAPEADAAGGTPGAPQEPSEAQGALPAGWQIVQDGPDYFTAERYVESLGLQKVSEGATSIEELAQKCSDYDDHQANLGDGWPNVAVEPGIVEAAADTETAAA